MDFLMTQAAISLGPESVKWVPDLQKILGAYESKLSNSHISAPSPFEPLMDARINFQLIT